MSDKLSHFANSIFTRTYAFHPAETWTECAARVAKAIANDYKQEQQFFNIISNRYFIPGGRYLYTAGREILQCSNCLPSGSLVSTSRGLVPIENLKIGDKVLAADTNFYPVTQTFMIEDETMLIQTTHGTLEATGDHPWFVLNRGKVATSKLKSGDVLESMRDYVLKGTDTNLPQPQNSLQRRFKKQRSPIQVKHAELCPEIAWLIGLIQGDGYVGIR